MTLKLCAYGRRGGVLLALALALGFSLGRANERPNFVFVLSEDSSAEYFPAYGDAPIETPAIRSLAAEGVVFEHAFSCAPVCSVARTTLATGVYAPRGGFQYHRKSAPARLPDGEKMWAGLLRDAGFHTTNNSKKDYNVVEGPGIWDASSRNASWRDRPSASTPFFHMRTFTTSHESSLHFGEESMQAESTRVSPSDVDLADYHPDTPTFRYTYARYYDRIRQIDARIGSLVDELKEDGLLESTFIFFFGDHGGVLPRSKGYAYESGLRVPLVVRIPEKFRDQVHLSPGSRETGFVEFVDFGPTVLHLAGIQVPEFMDGRPFMGPEVDADDLAARNETFGHADRFDEKYDLVRTLRVGNLKYIRNYTGYYPDGLRNNYRYRMLAYREWKALYHEGELDDARSAFFEARPVEQLFDLESDPDEVHDLAGAPEYRDELLRMRRRLRERMLGMNDLSLLPEGAMVREALEDPIAFGRSHAESIRRWLGIVDLSLSPFEEVRGELESALVSDDAWSRYWGLVALSSLGESSSDLAGEARRLLDDPVDLTRLRAAEFLGILGLRDPRPTFYDLLNGSPTSEDALVILNSVTFFHEFFPGWEFDVQRLVAPAGAGWVERRFEFLRESN